MPRHPLDGARLKIIRAKKHLQSLKDEIAAYLDKNPYEFPVQYDGEAMTARPAIIKDGCESPEELSCVVSECITPLRSALDYIAWELATRFAATPPVVGKNRDISFPIFDTATGDGTDRFAKMVKKWSFPADAVALIESVQPYQTGYEPMAVLSSLRNRDEHCLPLLTVAYAETASIKVSVTGQPLAQCDIHPPGSMAIVSGFNTFGMIVRKLTLDDLNNPPSDPFAEIRALHDLHTAAANAPAPGASEQQPRSVKVDGQVSVFVSLQDGPMPLVPVERTVEQLVECVANIVPRFEQFFL